MLRTNTLRSAGTAPLSSPIRAISARFSISRWVAVRVEAGLPAALQYSLQNGRDSQTSARAHAHRGVQADQGACTAGGWYRGSSARQQRLAPGGRALGRSVPRRSAQPLPAFAARKADERGRPQTARAECGNVYLFGSLSHGSRRTISAETLGGIPDRNFHGRPDSAGSLRARSQVDADERPAARYKHRRRGLSNF